MNKHLRNYREAQLNLAVLKRVSALDPEGVANDP